MICIKHDCNQTSSAWIEENILDVTSTDNKWVTAEPTFKLAQVHYCKLHFHEIIQEITGFSGHQHPSE
ncbi:hypothetical protein [Mesoplasma seiffertii]|uniref:hypothetical protein n=1 Tax=Mesoplasma seiffertii TaxID=28224 RepID=UPI0004794990|nr:hypothetical protein [Mesoplasma seiffertii]